MPAPPPIDAASRSPAPDRRLARHAALGPRLCARVLGLAAAFLAAAFLACAAEPPLKVCLVSGSAEYDSDRSLAGLKKHLEDRFGAACALLRAEGTNQLPGLEALERCDVALFFTRRLTLPRAQLERIQRYFEAGRAAVAVRTASHGFQNWLEFDKEVLGGSYNGHCGPGYGADHATIQIEPAADAKAHTVLADIPTFRSRSSLYRTAPLAPDTRILMTGTSSDCPERQPVTWTRERRGGRIVYTSLGDTNDFANAAFQRLLVQSLFWAARRETPAPTLPLLVARPATQGLLRLPVRRRVQDPPGSDTWRELTEPRELPASATAIVVCDMWDRHWCAGATARCGDLAAAMNPVLKRARSQGVLIVHCPSETMAFYAGTPARRRAQAAPAAPAPPLQPHADPPLPIDDSDGGCDTAEKPWYMAWSRQHAALEVEDVDALTDDGREVLNLFRQLGVRYVIVMGVHTNMCVLNRSFAIKQLTRWGFDCFLARDLTDAMYNPAMPPHVRHARGVELVVEHIEKNWCPSLLGRDILASP